jgi:hypothetical protein
MMARGKMSGIVWGKIEVYGEEGLSEVKQVLIDVVTKLGYPERKSLEDEKKEEDALKKELEDMGKDGAKDVVPLNRSGAIQGVPEKEDAM